MRRLYCRNLSPAQRQMFDLLSCDFGDIDEQEVAKRVIDMLLAPPFADVIELIPSGTYAIKALEAISLLLDLRPEDVEFYLAPSPDIF